MLGPLFFLIYVKDLPGVINQISLPTLFVDDTNIIGIHHNPNLFKEKIEEILLKISKWFQANLLTLNFNKINLFNSLQNSIQIFQFLWFMNTTTLKTHKVQAFWALL